MLGILGAVSCPAGREGRLEKSGPGGVLQRQDGIRDPELLPARPDGPWLATFSDERDVGSRVVDLDLHIPAVGAVQMMGSVDSHKLFVTAQFPSHFDLGFPVLLVPGGIESFLEPAPNARHDHC